MTHFAECCEYFCQRHQSRDLGDLYIPDLLIICQWKLIRICKPTSTLTVLVYVTTLTVLVSVTTLAVLVYVTTLTVLVYVTTLTLQVYVRILI